LLHSAFFVPAHGFEVRILASLKMLALAAAACWTGGWIFCRWERRMGGNCRLATTLPMMMFWWASTIFVLLFVLSWYFEVYYLPLREIPPW
jgi:hypothetical protein